MTIFQTTVLRKYIKAHEDQNQETLARAYQTYSDYFLKAEVQENIRTSKEEQFQEGFLRKLFGEVLGYTVNPDEGYNLKTEQKNEQDSKKADGAIIIESEVRAIIELKDLKTTNLKKVEGQAFGYKTSHKNCPYVITSNFEKLRFYIDNKTEHEEFNLFTLSREDFILLHLLLSYTSVAQNLPKRIKSESVSREDEVTTKLYKDYSHFKRALFADLCERNSNFDHLTLFKKSQKLLDRLLFIFFAEDKGLLPPNTIVNHIEGWKRLMNDPLNPRQRLYDRFKSYFGMLNVGNQDSGIFAYNGGLFAPDEILDSVQISDEVLRSHIERLAQYDFATEVDVNILGHIFENSLNEIEEVTAEITRGEKQVSKRKKDGVFYTPRYITSYIVENTLGRLCAEKKDELAIKDEDYAVDKRRQQKTAKVLADKLDVYRKWLLGLTICDPACGSGAFLNAALDFLIVEHRYIDELTASLYGGGIVFSDIENSILENNLYGVDINDESVEIARLSLWLRTARPQRKLNSLSNNIKCGNSLISDPEVAGDKAFDWSVEFPQVFERGGFDVVIGNPPYIQLQARGGALANDLEKCDYETFTRNGDIYCLFYELGLKIVKQNGLSGYITSNKWMRAGYGEKTRAFLSKYNSLIIIDLGSDVFEDATVFSNILISQRCDNQAMLRGANYKVGEDLSAIELAAVQISGGDSWLISSPIELKIKSKIEAFGTPLKKWNIEINYGIKTGYNDAFIISTEKRDEILAMCETVEELERTKILIAPILRGRDIKRYNAEWADMWLINTHNGIKGRVQPINIMDYPAVKSYLDSFWTIISKRGDKGETPYNLRNCAYVEDFTKPKIMYPNMTKYLPFLYDEKGYFSNDKSFIITAEHPKYMLALMNSKVSEYWIKDNCPEIQGGTRELRKIYMENLPLPLISEAEMQPFIDLADKMLELNAELAEKRAEYIETLKDNVSGIKITGALEHFDEMDFKDLLLHLKKQKITLPLSEQVEWKPFFTTYKTACNDLSAQIATTDRTIDQMVYALYNLTPDEIAIIEK